MPISVQDDTAQTDTHPFKPVAEEDCARVGCRCCAAGRVLRLVLQLKRLPAGQWQEALNLALRGICDILDCDNAIFIGWRRSVKAAQGDPIAVAAHGGWKPCLLMDAFGNEVEQERLLREWTSCVAANGPDAVTLGVLRGTGSLRGHLHREPGDCPPPGNWLHCGAGHAGRAAGRIVAAQGLDSLCEGVICVERFGSAPFEASQCDVLLLLMEATGDLYRRAMAGYGVFREQQSLSPRERDILRELLTTASEKEIAARLGLTVRTTHQYVTSVYRKMKAHSRAELMAQFFNV